MKVTIELDLDLDVVADRELYHIINQHIQPKPLESKLGGIPQEHLKFINSLTFIESMTLRALYEYPRGATQDQLYSFIDGYICMKPEYELVRFTQADITCALAGIMIRSKRHECSLIEYFGNNTYAANQTGYKYRQLVEQRLSISSVETPINKDQMENMI